MEKIKEKMAQEVSKIEERKAKIDDELKEVQVSYVGANKNVQCDASSPICIYTSLHPSLPYSLWWMKQSMQLETSSPKLCLRSAPSGCPLMSSEISWRGC